MIQRIGFIVRDFSARPLGVAQRMAMGRRVTGVMALLALSACSNAGKNEAVSSTEPDPMAAELANRAPVELPPTITSDVTMRCTDDSLVHVTFFTGDKQVLVRPAGQQMPAKLVAEKAGGPYTAEGYSLARTPPSVTLTLPGKHELSCKS